jgi:hypothetical protein
VDAGEGEELVEIGEGRRMADPAFRDALGAAQAEVLAEAVRALTSTSLAAVTTVRDPLDPPTPPAVRLGSARSVLELLGTLREKYVIEERVTAVEQALADLGKVT